MAILPTSNTGNTKAIDRTAGGSKPDSTPATGTTSTTITGAVTSVNGSIGVGASPTTGNVSVYLNTTGVTANTYGSSTTVPVIAVNAQGQITSATNTSISTLTNPMTTLGDSIYGGASGTATRLAGNTGSRRQYFSQTGTGSASAAPAWVNGPSYNVNDFGIFGGSGDVTSKINTMIGLVPDYATIYFPSSSGYFEIDGTITITNRYLSFKGDGPQSTVFTTGNSTNTLISTSGGVFSMSGITFVTSTRTAGNPLVYLSSTNNAGTMGNFSDVYFGSINGDGLKLYNSLINAVNCTFQGGASAGVLFHAVQSGIVMSNCNIHNANNTAPAAWIQGVATSIQISNTEFGGGGSLYKYTPSSVAISGSTLVINVTTSTGFNVDDYVILQNMTSANFNGFFRISSTTSTSITAIATPFYALPSGTCTIGSGTICTVPCALLIDNGNSAVNESIISNCLFGATADPSQAISASIYFQATYSSTLEGWCISNCFFDYGAVGMIIESSAVAAFRININNCISKARLGQYLISKSPSVMINSCQASDSPRLTNLPAWVSGTTYHLQDYISYSGNNFYCINTSPSGFVSTTAPSSDTTNWINMGPIPLLSFGVYAYSDSGAKSEGLHITSCYLGGTPLWNGINYSQTTPTYSVVIDGQINTFFMASTIAWGLTAPTYNINSGLTSGTLVGGGSNLYLSGTGNPPTKNSTPTYFP